MTVYPLQNHIHLATTLGGSPEFAPAYKWKITDRVENPAVTMSIQQSPNGKIHRHITSNGGGIVRLKNMKYVIKVQADFGYDIQTRLQQLYTMNGSLVYLCDSWHPNDGTDHTAAVIQYYLQLGTPAKQDPGLQFFLFDITLFDKGP